jgi:hypothetical protein
VGAPTVSITAPVNGADYVQGEVVDVAYTCTASAPAVINSCSGTVPSGSPLPTATPGAHSFTVNTRDSVGGTATRTVVYIVSSGRAPAPAGGSSAPVLTNVGESATKWREGRKQAQISGGVAPVGTSFSFSLSEPAAVTFSFLAQGARGAAAPCAAQPAAPAGGTSCPESVDGGSFSFPAHAGPNRVLFQGRLSPGQKLRSGRYVLTIGATDTAGRSAAPQQLSFTVVR